MLLTETMEMLEAIHLLIVLLHLEAIEGTLELFLMD
jgi:hypothetical protein